MSKLTAQEILKIIEENYSESRFAYNDWLDTDKVEVPSEVGQQEQKDKDDFWESIKEEMKPLTYTQRKENSKFQHYELMPGEYEVKKRWILDYLGLGEVEEVAQYGGEGMGSTWYSVKHFKDHGVFIRIDGHYQSYSGTEFYDGYGREVVEKEKTVVVWE